MSLQKYAWAVVHVWRGIPGQVRLFSTEESARDHEKEVRQRLPVEDEVGVFKVVVPGEVAT